MTEEKAEKSPLITVVTVCLNSISSIEDTLKNVVANKGDDIEFIVIDGGSQDGTLDIINSYSNGIDILISEKDEGIYHAMNKGIASSRGEYILFLNSGDLLADGAIESMKGLIKGNQDIYYGRYYTYKDVGGKRLVFEGPRCHDIYREIPTSHNAMLTARRAFNEYGDYNTAYRLSADYEWICRNKDRLKVVICDEVFSYVLLEGLSEMKNLVTLREKALIAEKYFGRQAYLRHMLRLVKITPLSLIKQLMIKLGFFDIYLLLKHQITGNG